MPYPTAPMPIAITQAILKPSQIPGGVTAGAPEPELGTPITRIIKPPIAGRSSGMP